jgi:putative endonuclease
MPYYVYVLVCEDGTFYTGYTRNVKARFKLHKKGKGAKYVRIHSPEKIVYVEKFGTRSGAMKRERQIKHLTHAEKQKLVNSEGQRRKRKSS